MHGRPHRFPIGCLHENHSRPACVDSADFAASLGYDRMSAITIVGSYVVAMVMDVKRLPTEEETLIGRNFHTTDGGKGSNMAACAARLGAPTMGW